MKEVNMKIEFSGKKKKRYFHKMQIKSLIKSKSWSRITESRGKFPSKEETVNIFFLDRIVFSDFHILQPLLFCTIIEREWELKESKEKKNTTDSLSLMRSIDGQSCASKVLKKPHKKQGTKFIGKMSFWFEMT